MKCKICELEFDTYKKLARHIKDYHNKTSKEYFDLYLATEDNNHLCPVCGKETRFININLGYHKTCCHTCHAILQNNSYSLNEKEKINSKRKSTWDKKDLTEYKELQSNLQTIRWDNYSCEERQIIKEKQHTGFLNMSEESKKEFSKKASIRMKNYQNNKTDEEKLQTNIKISNSLKNYYKNLSKEEYINTINAFKDRLSTIDDEKRKSMNKKISKSMKSKSKEEWASIKQKEYTTKHKNNSFNTSKPENNCYDLLCIKFTNVLRNYKSEKYPYRCDFYIPEKDLYIECNFHWTHGLHPYTGSDEDLQLIDFYKNKNTQYYNIAIYIWSILDVNKLKIAKENNLNYLVFYSENDFISWFNNI